MCVCIVFFFNDTATTEIYTLSLHDALPILTGGTVGIQSLAAVAASPLRDAVDWSGVHLWWGDERFLPGGDPERNETRSEEHTSELQSRQYLVCRLLLEKKKNQALPYAACRS